MNQTPKQPHRLVFVMEINSITPEKAAGIDMYFSAMGFEIKDSPERVIYSKTVEMTENETELIAEFRDRLTAMLESEPEQMI